MGEFGSLDGAKARDAMERYRQAQVLDFQPIFLLTEAYGLRTTLLNHIREKNERGRGQLFLQGAASTFP